MAFNEKVIETLKQTLSKRPRTTDIHLDYMHMSDLTPYLNMLSQFRNLKSLSLYDNRLKQLPNDMSCLQNLESLDISNNLLHDVEQVVDSLKTLPNLKILKYPVKKQKQQIVYQNLRKLQLFNDYKIIRQAPKKPIALKFMRQDVLNTFKKQMLAQFSKIQQMQENYLQEKSGEYVEQKFINEMNNIISDSMRVLVQKQGQMTQSLEVIYFNKTKYQIYQAVKNRCLNIAMDYYGELGKLIKEVLDVQNKLFEAVLHEAIKLVQFQFEMNQIQRQNREKSNDPQLQKKIIEKNQQLQKQIRRMRKKIDQLTIQNNQVQSQNKSYLQSLYRFSRGDRSGFINLNSNYSVGAIRQTPNQSFSHSQNATQLKLTDRSSVSPHVHRQRDTVASHLVPKTPKSLTLNQLKKTIFQIYENKAKFDRKNFQSAVPIQTMHQFLFTHLNQKYGLKNLTIDAASSIVSAVQLYMNEDNDVAVFGKILKNQIDQEFKEHQFQVKERIQEIVLNNIKYKARNKGEAQLSRLLKEKMNGEISSTQAQDIVASLYPKSQAFQILRKLEIHYDMSAPKQDLTPRRFRDETMPVQKQKKRKVAFSVLQKIILDFELKYRERELRPVVREFKTRDRDQDGVVDDDEFTQIIQNICEEAVSLVPQMLLIVDPYETKSITFSQLVSVIDNYPENHPILSRLHEKMDEPMEEIQ